MTNTLLSLLSISIGIIGANTFAYFIKKYSFELTGNTLIGVFGSVFLIKSFGRLGFSPTFVTYGGSFHLTLFLINLTVSFLGGILGLIFLKKIIIYTKAN